MAEIKIHTSGDAYRDFILDEELSGNVNEIPNSKAVKDYVDANAGGGGGDGWTYARKTGDTTRTSTTASIDTDFSIDVVSGGVYEAQLLLIQQADGDLLNALITVPTSVGYVSTDVQLGIMQDGTSGAAASGIPSITDNPYTTVCTFGFTTNAAGQIKFLWSASTTTATVFAGSFLKIKKLN